jgi:hypothetical protein
VKLDSEQEVLLKRIHLESPRGYALEPSEDKPANTLRELGYISISDVRVAFIRTAHSKTLTWKGDI